LNTSTDLSTLFIGRNVLEFGTLDSANSYALSLLAGPSKIPEGTVIMASEQKAGRGQAFTSWESEPGKNLLLAIILYPQFVEPSKIFLLSQTISLGVMETLKELLGEEIHIKWPNDIYYGDRKICGLLIENSIRAMHINYSVVGIGLNVNQERFSDLIPNPVSVRNILGRPCDLKEVFHLLCNKLEKRYLQLKAGQARELKSDYLKSLYRYNETHTFEYGGQKFKAKIVGVGEDGKLVLEYGNNLTGRYDFKTIHFVLNED
jgi:BirA family biotin operon repressor/biotin-[acetyl-CoA-carboxylase] ligase